MSVLIETTIGDFVFDLFTVERERTCLNFLKLCKLKFYNHSLFHFVKRDFIAQTGDPTGHGDGGESIYAQLYGEQAKYFEGEIKPRLRHLNSGTLSMVNRDNVGSQFFITLGENLTYLDNKHVVFGQLSEGLDVLEKLNETLCDDDSRPYQDIRICHTIVLEDPFEDPEDLRFPSRSPSPSREVIESDRFALEEEIAEDASKTAEEIEEEFREKQARAQAQVLEMIGDLPTADMKPPENVLFVCKLNPATSSEDLHIIFSRFGEILSCEVIRDWKTGNSLQYAFIEFDQKEDCEAAYFKMDNVLIDDRRIHVDFSQSVAKANWQSFIRQRNNNRKTGNNKRMAGALSDEEPPEKPVTMRKIASALSDDERPLKKEPSPVRPSARNPFSNKTINITPRTTEQRSYRKRSQSREKSPQRRSRDEPRRSERDDRRPKRRSRSNERPTSRRHERRRSPSPRKKDSKKYHSKSDRDRKRRSHSSSSSSSRSPSPKKSSKRKDRKR